jgi:uncharacterized protein (TIGR03435 family)
MAKTGIDHPRSYAPKTTKRFFGGAGFLSVIAISNILPSAAMAQAEDPLPVAAKPRFSAAEVKPCDPKNPVGTFRSRVTARGVTFACQPLDRYIFQAYGLYAKDKFERYQESPTLPDVEGGPRWIHNDQYEIIGIADPPTDAGVVNGAMMRALLEEQFQLKLHREPRQLPVYELVVAKSGLRLPPAKTGCLTPQEMPISPDPGAPIPPSCFAGQINDSGFTLLGSTIANFCYVINARLPPRIVRNIKIVDKTGVTGKFDFNLPFSLDPGAEGSDAPRANPAGEGPYFDPMQAALRKVGLQLVLGKGTGDALVVDRVERPPAN